MVVLLAASPPSPTHTNAEYWRQRSSRAGDDRTQAGSARGLMLRLEHRRLPTSDPYTKFRPWYRTEQLNLLAKTCKFFTSICLLYSNQNLLQLNQHLLILIRSSTSSAFAANQIKQTSSCCGNMSLLSPVLPTKNCLTV